MSEVWDHYGSRDPYYGVLSVREFRMRRMDDSAMKRFFESGIKDVDLYIEMAEKAFGPLTFGTALDYGCGVGRLSRRLVDWFGKVISVDISEGMLQLARQHLAGTNAEFENARSMSDTPTNFIISQMVFQHIAPDEGLEILPRLASRLDGTGIIEMPTRDKASSARKVLRRIRRAVRGALPGAPIIPMYTYDVLQAVSALESVGCKVEAYRFDTPMFENARLLFSRSGV